MKVVLVFEVDGERSRLSQFRAVVGSGIGAEDRSSVVVVS